MKFSQIHLIPKMGGFKEKQNKENTGIFLYNHNIWKNEIQFGLFSLLCCRKRILKAGFVKVPSVMWC